MVKVQFPKFGSRVTFNAVLYRQALEHDWHEKRWLKGGTLGLYSKPGIQKGIVIGYRWLRNVRIDCGEFDSDCPTTFQPVGDPIPAVLVAYHPRRKPVLVPMDGLLKYRI